MWNTMKAMNLEHRTDTNFYLDLYQSYWPEYYHESSSETGKNLPFRTENEPYSDFLLRFKYRCCLTPPELTPHHVFDVIEETLDLLKSPAHAKNEALLLLESMRWINHIFVASGAPEMRIYHRKRTLTWVAKYIVHIEALLDTSKCSHIISMCCRTLGVLFSDPDVHHQMKHSTINKVFHTLFKWKDDVLILSNNLWCMYMISISPTVSVYQTIHEDYWGFDNLKYILSIPSVDGDFLDVLDSYIENHSDRPDILAKCFRILANVACLPDCFTFDRKLHLGEQSITAMTKYADSVDVQSKCMALFVNIHVVYPICLARLLPLMLQAVARFQNEYLFGKFIYVIENCLHDGHFLILAPHWGEITSEISTVVTKGEWKVVLQASQSVLDRMLEMQEVLPDLASAIATEG